MMNWNVGKRIKEDVLLNKRADYGEQALKRLAQKIEGQIWKQLGLSETPTLCTRCVHFQ